MESLLTSTISSNATKVSEEKIACSTSRTNVHTLIVFLLLQGRLAIEWVIQKINDEIKDLSTSTVSAIKSTDEFINSTKRSIDDIAHTAKKSMDDLSTAAKKSLDDFLPTSAPQTPPSMPLPKF